MKVKETVRSRILPLHRLLVAGAVIATMVFGSCSKRGNELPAGGEPQGKILDRETFEQLYIALLEGAETHRALADTLQRKFDTAPIFTQFNVTEADFRTTVESYRKDVREWQEFYKRVIERLEEKEENRIQKQDTVGAPAEGAPIGPS